MNSTLKEKAHALFTAWMLIVLPLSAIPAMAQATTGTLRGMVIDPNGGIVVGATVIARNENTGTSTTPVATTSEGVFEFSALLPGIYTVTVEASGFKRFVATTVQVKVGIVNPFDAKLEAGNVSETVMIVANTEEVIQRDQSQISTTIDSRRIAELPSNGAGNGLDTLALLAPGVIANRGGGTNTNGTGLSVNGNRGRSNNFQIDGSDNNDLNIGGPALFVSNQDQVQEYQVITNNFSAQYGRNQGAIVNIVTKGGTNDFHGSAFLFHQDNKVLNSLDNIEKRGGQKEPNPSLYNVFGGTASGPIYLPRFGEGSPSIWSGKDRAFFFFSYQGIRNPSITTFRTDQVSILASEFPRLLSAFPGNAVIQDIANLSTFAIPGAQPRSDLSGQRTVFINPTTNAISDTQVAGTVGPFLVGGPYEVVNLGGQLFQAAQAERNVSTPATINEYSFRFDVKASNKDNVTFRLLKQRQVFGNALNSLPDGFNGDISGRSNNFGGTWTRQLSSTTVNEFRANYQKIDLIFGGGCDTATIGCIPDPAQLGSTITNISFPGLGVNNRSAVLSTIGPLVFYPQGRTSEVYQFADNLTWVLGRHSLILGAEYKHLSNVSPFLPYFNGAFAFSSAARIINNAPSQFTLAVGDPFLSYPENDQYYFVQDDFKVRPNLTLNLGVRYEYTGQPFNVLNKISTERESNLATAFYDPALPLSLRTVPTLPADKNNIAPRVGFAYSPHFWKGLFGEDATVIRGGFSIAYDATFYNILTNVQSGAPFSATIALGTNLLPATNSPLPLPGGTPTGELIRNRAAASSVLPVGKLDPRYLSQVTVAPDLHSPYSEQWSLGVQHQFGRNNVAEVRYVGNHGVGLFQNVNDNFFVGPLVNGFTLGGITFPSFRNLLPAGTTAQVCVNDPATFPNEGICNNRLKRQAGITTRTNSGQSIYHSMQSRYNGRFLNNSLTLGAAYTWSKTIDNASEIFGTGNFGLNSPNAQNPFCLGSCERSLSQLDRPHAFSVNFLYDVPLMKEQRGFLGHVLGGWQVNGVYVLTSGTPYTPSQTFNSLLLGLGSTYLTSGERPFVGNPNADQRQVGISQIDAFILYGAPLTNQNGFYSLNALNSTGDVVSVTPNDVRFIFNGPGAAKVFGTPFGTAARNSLRGPALNQLNASLFKNVKVGERVTVQFRADAFNVLNHPNPGYGVASAPTTNLPNYNVDSNAGVAGSAFAENRDIELARRVIQVGLRIIF